MANVSNVIMISCVLNIPLMLISITGNSLVFAAILRTPSLRSPSTVFLCNLVFSDLLVGLVVQPAYIATAVATKFEPGPLYEVSSTLFTIACGVSICTMTAISVDRFWALHYHMRYPTLMTEKCAAYSSATIWFGMITLSCLSLWNKKYSIPIAALGTAICIIISSISYIRIYQIVRHHQLQIHAQQQAVSNSDLARTKKSALNTFIYYICMIICYSPFFIYMLLLAIFPTINVRVWNPILTTTFMNSSVNPGLFCWRVRKLRSAVIKTWRCLLGKQAQQN